jgi:hypothetical protein
LFAEIRKRQDEDLIVEIIPEVFNYPIPYYSKEIHGQIAEEILQEIKDDDDDTYIDEYSFIAIFLQPVTGLVIEIIPQRIIIVPLQHWDRCGYLHRVEKHLKNWDEQAEGNK